MELKPASKGMGVRKQAVLIVPFMELKQNIKEYGAKTELS